MVTRDTTSATEALQLMVERHFRHLVCLIVPLVSRLRSFAHYFPSACMQRRRECRWSSRYYQGFPRSGR